MYFESLSLSRTKGRMEVNIHTMKMHDWCERPCGWSLVFLCERTPALKNMFGQNPEQPKKWDRKQCGAIAALWAGTETLQVWHEQKERLCRCLQQTSKMHSGFHQPLPAMSLSIHLLCWKVGLGNVAVGMAMCCFLQPTLQGVDPQERIATSAAQILSPCCTALASGLGVSFGVDLEMFPASFQVFSMYSSSARSLLLTWWR